MLPCYQTAPVPLRWLCVAPRKLNIDQENGQPISYEFPAQSTIYYSFSQMDTVSASVCESPPSINSRPPIQI